MKPEDTERLEYEFLVQENTRDMRDVFKRMRFAINALDDGLPRLAQKILGDALRTYGEEQP